MFKFFTHYRISRELNIFKDDIDGIIKILAVATFLDGEIKEIEMLNTKIIINNFIEHLDIRENKREALNQYVYKKCLSLLKKMKNDIDLFKHTKNEVLKILSLSETKIEIEYIKKIIESDNIITSDERDFLDKLNRLNLQDKFIQAKTRRGFTMIELIFVIIGMSILSYYTLQAKRQADFYSTVDRFVGNVNSILNNAVMDTVTGYINGTGGDCSDDNSYSKISAGKVIDCVGWGTTYSYGGTKDDDGADSYVEKLLKEYTSRGDGCKIYIDDISSDEYYVFFDCSNVNFYPSDRSKKYIEEKLVYDFTTNFSTIYQSVNRDSTAIDNDTGGNDRDGMIRFKMKK